jgi:murein DD-endopeptidase MepM/ murein hydrolase activator NlpD
MEISLLRPLPEGIGTVSQWFGENPAFYSRFGLAGHNGLDYAAPLGTPVLATHGGRCTLGRDDAGYGLHVRIVGDDYETLYAHLGYVLVVENQRVGADELIGGVGSTGLSTGTHLHFGLKLRHGHNPAYRDWVDPAAFREVSS